MRLIFRKWHFVSFLLLFFCFPQSIIAQETLKVAVSILEPWKIMNNGKLEGPEIEIIESIATKLGMPVVYRVLPFKRCLAEMQNGDVDLMTGLLKKQKREKYIFYIDPPYKSKSNKVFYVLRGNEKILLDYKDLHELKVGVKRGAKYFSIFDNDKLINKVEVNNYGQKY